MAARKEGKRGQGSGGFRDEQREFTSGLSATRLAAIFHTTLENVRRKIAHLKPISEFNGHPQYDLYEAAQVLVKPKLTVEYLKTLRPQDLPPATNKALWEALKIQRKMEEEAGDLWRTGQVQQVVGDLVKIVRERAALVADTIERQVGLSGPQRAIVQQMMDAMQNDVADHVVNSFKGYSGKNDHPPAEIGAADSVDVDTGEYEEDPDEGL